MVETTFSTSHGAAPRPPNPTMSSVSMNMVQRRLDRAGDEVLVRNVDLGVDRPVSFAHDDLRDGRLPLVGGPQIPARQRRDDPGGDEAGEHESGHSRNADVGQISDHPPVAPRKEAALGKGAGLVMPFCNTEAMTLHLQEIALAVEPGAHAVVFVDRAGWHVTAKLRIPHTMTLVPLPSKSPELNPVENIWQYMRDNWLSNRISQTTRISSIIAVSAGTN